MSGRPNYATLVPSEQGEALIYVGPGTRRSRTIGRFKDSSKKAHTKTQEGLMKRQVAEAWKNVESKEGDINEALGIQEPCHCCRRYGLPCLQNKSSEGKANVPQDHQT